MFSDWEFVKELFLQLEKILSTVVVIRRLLSTQQSWMVINNWSKSNMVIVPSLLVTGLAVGLYPNSGQ